MSSKKQGKREPVDDTRWDDVRLFLAIHRTGNLGGAGRRLGLDISTVSRRLAAFEEALGARLFDRSRRGLAPTRAAESVLAAAEAMEVAHARLSRDASALEAVAEGVVRLSVPPGISDAFVAPLLADLHAKHPRIVLEIDATIRVLDLTRHEADLALRTIRPESAELVMTKILSARSIPMGSAALVKSLGRLRDWNDAAWIVWDHDLASLPDARWVAQHVDRGRVVLRTSHFASQLVAAVAGLGVVMAPEPYMHVRPLVAVRFDPALASTTETWPTGDLWLVGHRVTREIPRVAVVWSFLLESLRAWFGGNQTRSA